MPTYLVTPGGGQDGYYLLNTYLDSLVLLPQEKKFQSLIFCGPEISNNHKEILFQKAKKNIKYKFESFLMT